MSKNNNNNGNRPVVENTEVIQESVKVMNEVETPVVKEAPVAPKAPEVKQTPVEETPKEEVKQEVKEDPVQPVREEVKVVEGVIINGYSIPVEDHKKEESHNVFIEDIKPIIPLGGVKGPLSIKLTESVIKHVLSFGYRVATLNEDGSRFYVHTDANGKLKVKK
jgi:predicted GNAT superfamily acetyltransferase